MSDGDFPYELDLDSRIFNREKERDRTEGDVGVLFVRRFYLFLVVLLSRIPVGLFFGVIKTKSCKVSLWVLGSLTIFL